MEKSIISEKITLHRKHNQYKLTYTVRNCFFEPSSHEGEDVVESCLNQVEQSFKNRKPAIISSHRINYIGFIQELNRTRNLEFLFSLLNKILKRWPDVEFLTSQDLALML